MYGMLTSEREAVLVPCQVCGMGARVNCRDAAGRSIPAHPLRHARAIATNDAEPIKAGAKTFRHQALKVPCQVCRVAAGEPCLRKDGTARKSCHKLRHQRAIAAGAPASQPTNWYSKRA